MGTSTGRTAPSGLAFKVAATTIEAPATVNADEGIVEAIVSVTGVEDSVKDVIVPGAYTKTLQERRPKVCWAHSWEEPIGRVLSSVELPPGDSRLPAQTKDGKPWPKAAGALLVTMQFNLKSDRGREAFEAVRFFSESGECEWSIGYVVTKATKGKDGVREIKELSLFEVSFVLFGAASLSTTMSLKDAVAAMAGALTDAADGDTDDDEDGEPGDPVLTDDDIAAMLADVDVDEVLAALEDPDDDEDDLDDEAAAQLETLADDLVVDEPDDDADADDEDEDDSTADAVTEADEDDDPATDDEDAAEDADPADDDDADADVADEAAPGDDGDGFDPAALLAQLDAPAGDATAAIAAAADAGGGEGKAAATPPGAAARPSPAGKPGEKPKEEGEPYGLEVKYDTSPVGTPGGRQNWVDKAGGLPPFIRAVAHALIRAGRDKQTAIRIAIGRIRDWAEGKGNVTAKTRAKAQATIAQWEKMRASSRTKSALAAWGWDPTLEVGAHAGTKAAPVAVGEKAYGMPRLPGTWEERRDALQYAVELALRGDRLDDLANDNVGVTGDWEWPYVSIDGTWDDRVIATRTNYRSPGPVSESFEIGYTWDGDAVSLDVPVPVTLSIRVDIDGVETDATDHHDVLGLADAAAMVTAGANAALRVESKAGRVLSGVNGERLRAAVQALLAVLAAAGIDVSPDKPSAPTTTPSPAPAAPAAKPTTEGKDAVDDTDGDGALEAKGAVMDDDDFDPAALLALLD